MHPRPSGCCSTSRATVDVYFTWIVVQVMMGYLNNPAATQDCIDEDNWFHTGDVGYFDSDGHFYITDRLKELIKVKGFQVG